MSTKVFIEKYTQSQVKIPGTADEGSSSTSLVFDLKENKWQRSLSSESSATSDSEVENSTNEIRSVKYLNMPGNPCKSFLQLIKILI